jgi:hypothetical protein
MSPEPTEVVTVDRQEQLGVMARGMLAQARLDDVIAELRRQAEENNRAAQAELPAPVEQGSDEWVARKAWLLDGQAIHGEVKTFYAPAYRALVSDDQVAYSRQRDLLMKALITIFGPIAQG